MKNVKNIINVITIFKCFIFGFLALLILDLFIALLGKIENCEYSGLISRLCGWLDCKQPLASCFLNLEAMQAVAKTIGVCSILIAWIYAELDKQELGVKYSTALKQICREYHILVIVHIASVLICVWMTECGNYEISVISTIIILLCMCLQATVFVGFIQNRELRKECAVAYWKKQVEKSPPKLEELACLERGIPYDDCDICAEMCAIRNYRIYMYIKNETEHQCLSLEELRTRVMPDVLESLFCRWEYLLHGKTVDQRAPIIHISYKNYVKMEDKHRTHGVTFAFCASYILWYQREQNAKLNHQPNLVETMRCILEDVRQICGKLPANCQTSCCLELLYNLLSWAYFFDGQAAFFDNQLNVFGPAGSKWNTPDIKEWSETFIRKALRSEPSKCVFELAWQRSVQ